MLNVEAANTLIGGLLVFFNAVALGLTWPAVQRKYLGLSSPGPAAVAWMVLLIGTATVYASYPTLLLGGPTWALEVFSPVVVAAGVALFTVGAPLILVDSRTAKLPDALVLLLGFEVALAALLVILLHPSFDAVTVMGASGLLWLAPMFVGNLVGQVGLGDVKLAPAVGIALGTTSFALALVGLVLATFSAGVQAFAIRRLGTGRRFPLGPHLLGAAMFAWSVAALRAKLLM